jgi:hypothetical protein
MSAYVNILNRHPREGGGPALVGDGACSLSWVPAFAGMTAGGVI